MKTLKTVLAASCAAFSFNVHAFDWVCTTSTNYRVAIAAAQQDPDVGFGAAVATTSRRGGNRPLRRIERADLAQAYSGQPVLLGHTWLLAVMLPADHPATRQAFAELGVSPEAAERLAGSSGLIDRGIRIVQSESQVLDKVSSNPPAVGYVGFFTGGRDVALCF